MDVWMCFEFGMGGLWEGSMCCVVLERVVSSISATLGIVNEQRCEFTLRQESHGPNGARTGPNSIRHACTCSCLHDMNSRTEKSKQYS